MLKILNCGCIQMSNERYVIEGDKIYDTFEEKYISVNDVELLEDACRLLNEIQVM